MIYYRADAGFSTGQVTNLNQITWTDKDKFFTIATVDSLTEFNKRYTTLESAYYDYYSVLGEEINSIYGTPPATYLYNESNTSSYYDSVTYFVPSIPLAYPNLYDRWYSSNERDFYYLRVGALNNLLIMFSYSRNVTSGIARFARANPDGSIEYSSYYLNIELYVPNVSGYRLFIGGFGIVNYTQPLDLVTIGKVFYHSFGVYAQGNPGSVVFSKFQNDEINKLIYIFGDNPPQPDGSIIPPDNPYEPGGESGPGGGDGTFDNDSDPITDSPLPTLSSANTGFTRIYNPTLSQLQDLANYLWTDESIIQTIWNHIKQYFEDPMQAMIGLNLVPVQVPDSGSKNFALMFIDTGVSMNVAASQFVDVDCGTLEIKKYYGSALDYSPYTKVQVFLPYIGMVTVDTDEVMGRTLQVKYRVDIASGSCTAKIFVDGNVLYQYSGHCAIPVPLSSSDFSSYISSAISVAQLAGTAALAGSGIISPPPPTVVTQQTNHTVTNEVRDTARNASTGRQITTGTRNTTTSEETTKETSTQASFAGLTPQNITNTVSEVMGSKTHVEHSGSFSGNSGYLGVRYPYCIIVRPNMCMPGQYQHFNGFPCMMNLLLGDCKGFTQVQQVELTGFDATNPEQAEILELLKMGVYL